MIKSRIEVKNDDMEISKFVIISKEQIDSRLLQIVGLILDNGLSGEEIRNLWPTAAAYCSTDSKHTEKWVTDLINTKVVNKQKLQELQDRANVLASEINEFIEMAGLEKQSKFDIQQNLNYIYNVAKNHPFLKQFINDSNK